MTRAALLMAGLQLSVAAHVAEILPGGSVADSFVKYFNYEGGLEVSGFAMPILTYNAGQKLAYALEGVDPMCSERGMAATSCGMHIHQGTSCNESAGGLLSTAWLDVYYTAMPDGRASGMVEVETGSSSEDIIGKVFAIHDHAGDAIACSIITEMPAVAQATGFVPYAGYAGNLTMVYGGVYPIMSDGMQTKFTYDIIGADPACKMGPMDGVPTSCGLHIHEGTSCEEAAGNLLISGDVTPWLTTGYTTQGGANCTTNSVMSDPASCYLTGELETVDTGLTYEDILNHVFVLHDVAGTPYACSTIKADIGRMPLHASGFVPYYNYDTSASGALMVSGTVSPVYTQSIGVTSSMYMLKGMPAQSLQYDLVGVDPMCEMGPSEAANSCGVHIHAGMSCMEDAMGHYYSPAVGSDPWRTIVYSSDADGMASGVITGIPTGLPASEIVGHSMIIHDRAGTRVACAILSTDAPTMSPPSPPMLECPAGCKPSAARRKLLFSALPNCPAGCEPM